MLLGVVDWLVNDRPFVMMAWLHSSFSLIPKGQMSSELTFGNSGRLANEQIDLDHEKIYKICVGMTPSRGS
jgi:hypothetical protein